MAKIEICSNIGIMRGTAYGQQQCKKQDFDGQLTKILGILKSNKFSSSSKNDDHLSSVALDQLHCPQSVQTSSSICGFPQKQEPTLVFAQL